MFIIFGLLLAQQELELNLQPSTILTIKDAKVCWQAFSEVVANATEKYCPKKKITKHSKPYGLQD